MSISDHELIVTEPAMPEEGSTAPEHHRRAVFVMLGVTAAILAAFSLLMWMPRLNPLYSAHTLIISPDLYRRSSTNLAEIERLLFPCLLGCAIYLLAPYKRWGYRAAAIGCVILTVPVSLLYSFVSSYNLLGTMSLEETIRELFTVHYMWFPLIFQALSAAVILAVGFGVSALLKTSQRIIIAGGAAAVLGAALSFSGRFMPPAVYSNPFSANGYWTWFGLGPQAIDILPARSLVWLSLRNIPYCLLIFLSVWLVHSLCTMKSSRFNPGVNTRVWFVLVAAVYGFLIVYGIIKDTYNIVTLALMAALLSGLALMFVKQRAGWHIYMIGTGLSLAFVFQGFVIFFTVSIFIETDAAHRIGFILENLTHCVIPFLTWRIIRRKWQLH